MSVALQADQFFILTDEEVGQLWRAVREHRNYPDEVVTVRVVNEPESRRLNLEYRRKDAPTNVLTFSFPHQWEGAPRSPAHQRGEVGPSVHDIALCMSVVEREAEERGAALRDYTALVLVHAFLHATGLDHERSGAEAATTHAAEAAILKRAGFNAILW